jgi:4-aminobutyrate aminotransferase-like enzyme
MDKVLETIYNLDADTLKTYSKSLMLGGGTRGGPIVTRGKGVYFWDNNGKKYIDCTSQSWALYLGFSNDELNQVIHEHVENMTHIHQGYDTMPRFYLAHKLASIAPGDLNRVSFTIGGGMAIETAMKIAIKNVHPSRDFVVLWDSYAGTTLGAMGASWISTKSRGDYLGANNLLALTKPFIRIPNPVSYNNAFGVDAETYLDLCLTFTRETFKRGIAGKPAGVIIEPIQSSAGQIILGKRYLEEMRKICDEFGTLLIFDEIQTFGRIGEMFAADYFGVTPDIIVLGKGFGAGLPLAAIIISDKLEGFEPTDWEELHTFSNSSIAMVAAAKQLQLLEDWVLVNCRNMGSYLSEGLVEMQATYPEMGDIRQAGLHIGIEFVRDPITKTPIPEETIRIKDEALKNGGLFGLGGVRKHVLKIKPPLIVNKGQCDEILDILEKSIRKVLR